MSESRRYLSYSTYNTVIAKPQTHAEYQMDNGGDHSHWRTDKDIPGFLVVKHFETPKEREEWWEANSFLDMYSEQESLTDTLMNFSDMLLRIEMEIGAFTGNKAYQKQHKDLNKLFGLCEKFRIATDKHLEKISEK